MQLLSVLSVLLLGACATTTLDQIDRADRYLSSGDLDGAEASYRRARPNPNDPEPWVIAKIEHGLGRVALERMRRARPWRELGGSPQAFTRGIIELHTRVHRNGGDADLNRALAETSASYAKGLLAAFAKHDRHDPGGLAGFADGAGHLLALPMLADPIRHQLAEVIAAARDEHLRRSTGAPPLTSRLHAALAARRGGPSLPRSDLDAAYVPYVRTTFTGTACPNAPRSLGLPITTGSASVDVSFSVDVCTDGSRVIDTTESITWSTLFLERIDSKVVSETKCEQERIPTYVCSGSPPTCSYAGTSAGGVQCYETNSRTVYTAIYAPRMMTATRAAKQQSGSFEVRGTFTLRINGKELVEAFGGVRTLDGRSSESFQGSSAAAEADARTRGADSDMLAQIRTHPGLSVPGARSVLSMESYYEGVYAAARKRITALITAEYASRLASTEASARALDAANNTNAADEEWIKVALLGGTPRGRWSAWGIDAPMLRAAFAEQPTSRAPDATPLPAVVVVSIPPRPRATETDRRDSVHSQLPPLNEALWLAADVDWLDVPPVMVADPRTPGQMLALGDTTGLTIAARIGGPLIGLVAATKRTSGQHRGKFGWAFVDDASVELAAGHAVSSPEGVSPGGFLRVAGRYQAGLGYRRRFLGGVFVGLRGEAAYQQLGTSASANYASVTPFARLELALFRRTLALEGMDRTLAGDAVRHLGVYLSRLELGTHADRFTHFLWFQYSQRAIDATFDVPQAIDQEVAISDLVQRTYTVGYGVGF